MAIHDHIPSPSSNDNYEEERMKECYCQNKQWELLNIDLHYQIFYFSFLEMWVPILSAQHYGMNDRARSRAISLLGVEKTLENFFHCGWSRINSLILQSEEPSIM
ncbi:hypothetical protein E2542_SST21719 [Spatholobus suberectus]|nr:hypothetical protein E2542_SST21719 [Spatholobus suberectus]